jgi:cytochrome b561
MAPQSPPAGYSLSQILLHWIIALLVAVQLFSGEGMEHFFDASMKGQTPNPADLAGASIHKYVGIAIFVLMVLRLIVRAINGAPPAPPGTSGLKRVIAASTQHLLYLVLLLMPVGGAIALYGQVELAGDIHKAGMGLILLLLVLHVLGALVQHFIAKTDVLVRIFRPVRAS